MLKTQNEISLSLRHAAESLASNFEAVPTVMYSSEANHDHQCETIVVYAKTTLTVSPTIEFLFLDNGLQVNCKLEPVFGSEGNVSMDFLYWENFKFGTYSPDDFIQAVADYKKRMTPQGYL